VQKYVSRVDRVKSFQTSISLQKSASRQPRTGFSKFAKISQQLEKIRINIGLADKEYTVEDAKLWTIDLCNDIKTAVKELCNVPRYKIMCQVPARALGQN